MCFASHNMRLVVLRLSSVHEASGSCHDMTLLHLFVQRDVTELSTEDPFNIPRQDFMCHCFGGKNGANSHPMPESDLVECLSPKRCVSFNILPELRGGFFRDLAYPQVFVTSFWLFSNPIGQDRQEYPILVPPESMLKLEPGVNAELLDEWVCRFTAAFDSHVTAGRSFPCCLL